MYNIRSQVAQEFLIMVMILFMIFVAFYTGSFELIIKNEELREQYAARDLGFKIREEILIAHKSFNGYERHFTLDEVLQSRYDYTLSIESNTIIIETDKTSFDITVPSVNATIADNQYDFKITKIEGVVYLENS
jgi:hypothetical protein